MAPHDPYDWETIELFEAQQLGTSGGAKTRKSSSAAAQQVLQAIGHEADKRHQAAKALAAPAREAKKETRERSEGRKRGGAESPVYLPWEKGEARE